MNPFFSHPINFVSLTKLHEIDYESLDDIGFYIGTLTPDQDFSLIREICLSEGFDCYIKESYLFGRSCYVCVPPTEMKKFIEGQIKKLKFKLFQPERNSWVLWYHFFPKKIEQNYNLPPPCASFHCPFTMTVNDTCTITVHTTLDHVLRIKIESIPIF